MEIDEVWRHIDAQRARFCDLVEGLDEEQLATRSLCEAWTTRDVAAHLALSQSGAREVAVGLVRGRGSFDRMIRDTALRRAASATVAEDLAAIRAMVGSRRRVLGVSPIEPLTDVLVHTQDVARPLGLEVPMPLEAAATSADRVWSMGFPWFPRRRFRGRRLVATDTDWSVGEGEVTEAPMADLLLLLTGRPSP
jgi:uncharacterized protein (TIGR03083 family)